MTSGTRLPTWKERENNKRRERRRRATRFEESKIVEMNAFLRKLSSNVRTLEKKERH
jgi:hypothetical protein